MRTVVSEISPYYVYGGQQDNSSVAIPSSTNGRGIDWSDWYRAAGCESAYLAFDPDNPVDLYGGCYQGLIEKLNIKYYETFIIHSLPNSANLLVSSVYI